MTSAIRTASALVILCVLGFLLYGYLNYPSRAGKLIISKKAQNYGDEYAKQDATDARFSSLDFNTSMNYVGEVGGHAYEAEEIKRRGLAKAEGRTLQANGIYVSALQASWKQAQNNQGQPIEVTKGEFIWGTGAVHNTFVIDGIPPDGIVIVPEKLEDYIPIAGKDSPCRRFSLCGLVIDQNGRQHLFHIGSGAVVPASGQLWLVVNIPFKGPYGRDQDMFTKFSNDGFDVHGNFQTLSRNLHMVNPNLQAAN